MSAACFPSRRRQSALRASAARGRCWRWRRGSHLRCPSRSGRATGRAIPSRARRPSPRPPATAPPPSPRRRRRRIRRHPPDSRRTAVTLRGRSSRRSRGTGRKPALTALRRLGRRRRHCLLRPPRRGRRRRAEPARMGRRPATRRRAGTRRRRTTRRGRPPPRRLIPPRRVGEATLARRHRTGVLARTGRASPAPARRPVATQLSRRWASRPLGSVAHIFPLASVHPPG